MMGRGHDHMMGPGMMGRSAPPLAVTPAPTATPGGTATVSYRRDIQPIFDRNCVSCHGGQAGLYLDSYDRLMAGSARGPVVVPGDPQASELVRRITGQSQPAMPLGRAPLSAAEIEAIVTWIAEGAPNN
jgi:mono/diheme cytochrome c family protein